jgi:phytoene dehydrogenase-like protein
MKIAIIGAGISGLSAGCYLKMNGFDTEIFEMHSRSGGLCTSWKQGGFTFNGSLHWLMGSGESSPFFKLWSELIDMNSIRFYNPEIRLEIETLNTRDRYGDNIFHLYTNLNRLQDYMLDLAPEDERVIRRFIGQIRRIQKFELPPMIRNVPQLLPWYRKMEYIRFLPLLFYLRKYSKITTFSFARTLKNPFLKEAFQLLLDGEDLPIMIHTIPLAYFDKKAAGYPTGGASVFAGKIEEKYRSLGGIIHFNRKVDKILVKENKAVGLRLENGDEVLADYFISAADWRFTVFEALEEVYVNKKILALGLMKNLEVFHSVFFVFLGLDQPFPTFSGLRRFPLEKPLVSPDGTVYNRMEVHVHDYDPTLAPAGKTVLSVCLYTHQGDHWIQLRAADYETYRSAKENFGRHVIEILETKLEGIRGHIEQTSMASPATFQRYTNNWLGSTQGWLPGKNMIAASPISPQLPGLKNFYISGHWTMPGGGLPVAIKSARDVAMMICHHAERKFKVPLPNETC